jgi:hypothetical protein
MKGLNPMDRYPGGFPSEQSAMIVRSHDQVVSAEKEYACTLLEGLGPAR